MARSKKPFQRDKWLIHQLRRLTLRYPPRIAVLNRYKVTYYIKSSTGKDLKRVSFQCEQCGRKGLKSKEVQVDHKVSVVSSVGFTNIQDFVDSLFCDESNLQVLCKEPCHAAKTKAENEARALKKKSVDKD